MDDDDKPDGIKEIRNLMDRAEEVDLTPWDEMAGHPQDPAPGPMVVNFAAEKAKRADPNARKSQFFYADRLAGRKLYPDACKATWNRQVIKPTQAAINYAAELGWCSRISVKRFIENPETKTPATLEWVRAFAAQAVKDNLPELAALCLFMFGTAARDPLHVQAHTMEPYCPYAAGSGGGACGYPVKSRSGGAGLRLSPQRKRPVAVEPHS